MEQQIKEVGVIFSNSRWAPSGQALYFEGTSRGVRNLWKVGLDPQTLRWVSGPERLTTGAGQDIDISLSSDGKKLAFITRTEIVRIWSIPFNATTGQVIGAGQPVTATGMDALQFDLSRDGKKLVFLALRAGKQELWEKSLEDGHETLLVADGATRYSPRWSWDGAHLAYRRNRPINPEQTQVESSLILLPAGGGDEQVLTSQGATLRANTYDWSADGAWVLGGLGGIEIPRRVFICLFQLAAAPHAETKVRVVTSHPEYNLWQARFSPDERWICFNTTRHTEAGVSTIFVAPASGGEWMRITESQYWNDNPRWSPDGKTIYFLSNRTGFFDVWGVRFDPTLGKPLGSPFRVTAFESPGRMVWPHIGSKEIGIAANRLALSIVDISGSVWVLENVDH